jgi:hypothetical protein
MVRCVLVCLLAAFPAAAPRADAIAPGTRVLLDAHNAYPYDGRYADRLDRALATGLPLAIEQDLAWYRDPRTGLGRSIVTHGEPFSGSEPTLREHFFERIRPVVEAALREDRRDAWPLVTLNLDFKTLEPEHLQAVWDLLGEYEAWLSTAERTGAVGEIRPINVGPVLVLTGEQDEQQRTFHDRLPAGARLRLFGAVHRAAAGAPPIPPVKTNYRRWSNNPWALVEPEGQPKSGAWTAEDEARLESAVRGAHEAGLWIRFYTLNGHDPADVSGGWSASYNFGSLAAVRERWRAAISSGVDFVAVDQYEEFVKVLRPAR